ncbi:MULTISPECIES: helix-hairpin-helix domain-containing protein [Corynebacterium]|uniref:ComEA family DNA-binding protein n=1 Tax=Corynebacterium TaxID=1716 RepID=UPI001EF32FBC|nr:MULTISPECIES: helix-hairpin-helix domain-containing protein [Corynebacterium]MCG7442136.1 helix-hairpin-helix domain-containing protein [Corynebacterium sp. ACRPQ]MCG7460444.1 helix-hairpin-helix domain-containing protein [Corynebacterium sp. ACRPF]MCG7465895.1 helix-hairpin-helix domain-containing protein [Corynebacterium sp. ACRPJ]MDK4229539.1 helix-hairpin-helix domain-containing protein [Corynebacterium tuberculostearicum]MDV2416636.1 helix-hairpin-helix domain-containing protein [Coryn
MAAPKISERLREFTQPTGEEELLAIDYPRPRLRISPWQACAVAVILVIGVVVWLGINARSEESSGMPEPAALSDAPSEEPSEIIVSVIGEVAEPGLKTLEPGARVADALAAAQPLPGAETMALNHAQRLSDGQQLHILPSGAAPPPAPGEPAPAGDNSSSPGGSASGSGVSLNNATAEELTELKGVGEVTALAIVAYREEHGGFKDVEELLEVSGIGPAKLAQLKDQVQL